MGLVQGCDAWTHARCVDSTISIQEISAPRHSALQLRWPSTGTRYTAYTAYSIYSIQHTAYSIYSIHRNSCQSVLEGAKGNVILWVTSQLHRTAVGCTRVAAPSSIVSVTWLSLVRANTLPFNDCAARLGCSSCHSTCTLQD
jgi:hypothetical protein